MIVAAWIVIAIFAFAYVGTYALQLLIWLFSAAIQIIIWTSALVIGLGCLIYLLIFDRKAGVAAVRDGWRGRKPVPPLAPRAQVSTRWD